MILFLGKGNVCSMPVAPLVLEVDTFLSGFTGSQLESNFASGRIIPRVLPIPDLDDI